MSGTKRRARQMAVVSSGVLAVLSSSCARTSAVETEPVPEAGVRVRLDLPGPRASVFGHRRQSLVGTLVGRDSAALHVRVGANSPPVHIPISALRATYRSDGPRPRLRAAIIGAVRGAAIGAASGLIMSAFVSSGGESAAGLVGRRAAGAAALGTATGLVVPGERWRRVRFTTPGTEGSR